jgi:hypothetical protein
MPIWDRSPYAPLCIEVLESQAHAETIVVVRIAIVVIEIERTSVAIIVIAPTIEEGIARIRKVRVGTVGVSIDI